MSIYFISDLHLHESRKKVTERFFKFLQEDANSAQALYILGDFFETWIGEDYLSLHDQKILNKLKEYAKNIPTYFMHGNRDFLLKESLLKNIGVTVLKDPTTIKLSNKRIVLMHGDSLCLNDINYQRFRRFVRNPIIQWLFLCFPFKWRQAIARKLRQNSLEREKNQINQIIPDDLTKYDVTEQAVLNTLISYQGQILIHGHTHKAQIHEYEFEGIKAQRIVLGDWGKKSIILEYKDDIFQLKEILIT